MRSSGVMNVLYVVRKASQYKTRSVEQKQREKRSIFELSCSQRSELIKADNTSSNVMAA